MFIFHKFKSKNIGIEEYLERRAAKKIIDEYLSQYDNIDEYVSVLKERGRDIIFDMIINADEEKVLKVLNAIEDIHKKDKEGNTYLSVACDANKVKIIKKLLDMDANLDYLSKDLSHEKIKENDYS